MAVGKRPQSSVSPIRHLATLDSYEGQWVAVKEDQVVLRAATSSELARELRSHKELRGAVMQFVQPEAHAFIVGVG